MHMHKPDGFTLVELAIVMIIIGLLTGGVLKGQQMIESAKVTGTISQIKAYQAALNSFKDTYGNIPGDMLTATARLAGCNGANVCGNGDGDGILGAFTAGASGWDRDQSGTSVPAIETTYFWKHLALADLITGVEINANPASPAWGATHPASRFNGGWHVYHDLGSAGGVSLRLSNPVTGAPVLAAGANVLSPLSAAQIDRKLDDARADSGMIWSMPRDASAGSCAPNGTYNEQVKQRNCVMHMHIDG